jgi:predicted transcriptional regulator
MTDIKIPGTLAERLDRVAATSGRRAEIIVREALEKQLDYEEWFAKAVQEGFESADREGWLSHEESKNRLKARIEAHKQNPARQSRKAA